MLYGHLDYCPKLKPPLGGRPNTKSWDHGTPNAHNHWSYSIFAMSIHWNSIWWRPGHIWLHTTLEDLWPHHMILEVSWDGLWTLFFLGSHNSMVRALGSCVKWPSFISKSGIGVGMQTFWEVKVKTFYSSIGTKALPFAVYGPLNICELYSRWISLLWRVATT